MAIRGTNVPKRITSIKIEGDIALIPLTQGMVAVIDARDVSLVEGYNWYAHAQKNTVYAVTKSGGGRANTKSLYLHRLLLAPQKGVQIDHIDGDGLNNRRSNLRSALPSENGKNRRTPKNNKSGYKGVHWRKDKQRWQAQIKVNYKMLYLGLFESPEQAHEAYKLASQKFHGEFGRLS